MKGAHTHHHTIIIPPHNFYFLLLLLSLLNKKESNYVHQFFCTHSLILLLLSSLDEKKKEKSLVYSFNTIDVNGMVAWLHIPPRGKAYLVGSGEWNLNCLLLFLLQDYIQQTNIKTKKMALYLQRRRFFVCWILYCMKSGSF